MQEKANARELRVERHDYKIRDKHFKLLPWAARPIDFAIRSNDKHHWRGYVSVTPPA
jgi:hypothetical protein